MSTATPTQKTEIIVPDKSSSDEVSRCFNYGRPTECTPEVTRLFCDAVRRGLPFTKAAAQAGMSVSAISVWRKKGRGEIDCPDPTPYIEFVEALDRAISDNVDGNLSIVNSAANGGYVTKRVTVEEKDGKTTVTETVKPPEWRAAAWILERRYPKEFAQHQEVKQTAKIEQKTTEINVDISANLDEVSGMQLAALLGQAIGQGQPNLG